MNKLINYGILAILSATLIGCGNGNRNTSNSSAGNTSSINAANSPTNFSSSNVNSASNVNNTNRVAVAQDNFWERAARGGLVEVATANLTLSKSRNPDVRKFAQLMIADHTKANDELKALAAKKNVTLPTRMGERQELLEDLNKLSGTEFDKEYVEAMVEDQEDTVELFKNEAENSNDAERKAFAAKTLPTLQSHLQMIRDIQSKMQ